MSNSTRVRATILKSWRSVSIAGQSSNISPFAQMSKSRSPQGGIEGESGTVLPRSLPESSRRIYVLGMGNIGKLFAHSLAGVPERPPITLLFHRPDMVGTWEEEGRAIGLITNGVSKKQTGYEVEVIKPPPEAPYHSSESPIDCLIITTKATNAVSALSTIKERLSHNSTILFTQNGMGVVESVNEKLFPDVNSRPTYAFGIVSHGVYSQRLFSSVHAGFGTVSLGLASGQPLPESREPGKANNLEVVPQSSRYLLQTVKRSPVLAAVEVSPVEILLLQFEKLVVNCIINPLTAIFDCRNGQLLGHPTIASLIQSLLLEIFLVVSSLPEIKGIPGVQSRFSPERLEDVVAEVAGKTANNISSMLKDVRAGKETEIDYINGYIAKRGEEVGVQCAVNRKLLHRKEHKFLLI